jgi:site-specific DNA recombinase
MMDILTGAEYIETKKEAEDKILRYEAELKELYKTISNELDVSAMVTLATSNLKKLREFYAEADPETKTSIIGSLFPEKWIFDGENHRTTQINQAAVLIYHINKKLGHKKTGIKPIESLYSGEVHL